MNKNSFIDSLNNYTWKRLKTLPIKWGWVGVGIAASIIVISWSYSGQTMVGVRSEREAIEKAARLGDYKLAQELYEKCHVSQCHDGKVLGADSELEELVYPERKVEKEITKYEELNVKYPENRDILLMLSQLYNEIGNVEKSTEYREEARVLDPNSEIFKEMYTNLK